jgi:hypothetical protein
MTAFYSIDSDNNLAVHPNLGDATKEAGTSGAAFAAEAQLSEATALWPASRLVEVWNSFAGAPPFADLNEVKKFTDRKTATMRIWTVAQRLGEVLQEEMNIVEQDMLRAQQEMLNTSKPAKAAKAAHTAAPKATAKLKQPWSRPARTARLRPSSAKARARPRWSRSSNAQTATRWKRSCRRPTGRGTQSAASFPP